MAGNSSPTDSHSESTCVNATAGAAMSRADHAGPQRRVGVAAPLQRVHQPAAADTPAVLTTSTTAPSI